MTTHLKALNLSISEWRAIRSLLAYLTPVNQGGNVSTSRHLEGDGDKQPATSVTPTTT